LAGWGRTNTSKYSSKPGGRYSISGYEDRQCSFNQQYSFPVYQYYREEWLKLSSYENEFVDFKIQPLLPHMHSRNGPGIATGDINGDGREDFYIGAAAGTDGSFFIQNNKGDFSEKKLKKDALYEDMGVLLFDADNDNDLDLYVVSGGSENSEGTAMQQDRLYFNDGKGSFTYKPDALPGTKQVAPAWWRLIMTKMEIWTYLLAEEWCREVILCQPKVIC
jgi:hypothetical protein